MGLPLASPFRFSSEQDEEVIFVAFINGQPPASSLFLLMILDCVDRIRVFAWRAFAAPVQAWLTRMIDRASVQGL